LKRKENFLINQRALDKKWRKKEKLSILFYSIIFFWAMKNDKGIKGTIDEVERVAYSILNDTLKLTKIFGKMKIFRT